MTGFLIITGVMVGASGLAWLAHLGQLRKHRGLSREQFVEHFEATGILPATAGAVYDQFQSLGFWKQFRPSPADTLEGTFKTVDEDVEENLKDILTRLEIEMPDSGTLQAWGDPIKTLSDVVRWVDWVSKKQRENIHSE